MSQTFSYYLKNRLVQVSNGRIPYSKLDVNNKYRNESFLKNWTRASWAVRQQHFPLHHNMSKKKKNRTPVVSSNLRFVSIQIIITAFIIFDTLF